MCSFSMTLPVRNGDSKRCAVPMSPRLSNWRSLTICSFKFSHICKKISKAGGSTSLLRYPLSHRANASSSLPKSRSLDQANSSTIVPRLLFHLHPVIHPCLPRSLPASRKYAYTGNLPKANALRAVPYDDCSFRFPKAKYA